MPRGIVLDLPVEFIDHVLAVHEARESERTDMWPRHERAPAENDLAKTH